MRDRPYTVLFLCNRNATRGLLAEALLRLKGGSHFVAHSAGSHPSGAINPAAVALLKRLKIPTSGLRSKSFSEFIGPDAPQLDFVISLCDKTIGEITPDWHGHPVMAQWSIPDPAEANGTAIEKARFLRDVFQMIERRISLFLNLPEASLDKLALDTRFRNRV